jgi:DNA-binding LacI/PurR family transcriptional regulator
VQIELTREGDFTFESRRVAAKQILDLQNRPTAIVASNDDMASGVVWWRSSGGWSFPAISPWPDLMTRRRR